MTVRHDLTLATFQEIFEPDGSLVDLYVLDISPEDWQQLLNELQPEVLPYKFWDFEMDDEPRRLSQRIETIFARGDEASGCLLTLDPEGLRLNCHFFTTEEIEFDLVPQDIQSEDLAARLADFIRRVSALLGKPVLLCCEGMPERPCFIASSGEIVRTC